MSVFVYSRPGEHFPGPFQEPSYVIPKIYLKMYLHFSWCFPERPKLRLPLRDHFIRLVWTLHKCFKDSNVFKTQMSRGSFSILVHVLS